MLLRTICSISFLILSTSSITIYASENDTEGQSRSQRIIHEPREDIFKSITSGEQAWLRSINNNHQIDPDYLDDDVDDDGEDITTTIHANIHENLNSRKKNYNDNRNIQRNQNNNKEENNESKLLFHDSTIANEFLQLSQPHDLNPTSSVDRVTMAELLNKVNANNDNEEQSLLKSTSTINTAYYFLALFNLYGLAGMEEPDIIQAFDWFRKAAENGHGEAQCALGLILYYGIDGKIGMDKKSAMRWFYHASVHSNHPRGHWLLGKAIYEGMFYDDIGIVSNDNESDEEFNSQDNIGSDDKFKVPTNDKNSIGDKKKRNFIEAFKLFKKAGDSDIPEALHQIAIMYEYGLTNSNKGQIMDPKERFDHAVKYYREASDLGYVESFYHLGLMYAYGRGVTLNYTKAADYFRQGIMNKHGPSMRYLGIFAMKGYDQAEGPNLKLAMYWFDQCIMHSKYVSQVKILCESELKELKVMVENIASYQST